MNRYSRVFHHISLDDVKRNKIKTEEKQKDFFKSIREARNFLRDLNSPYYSNWRSNPIEEGMNTGNTFQTTFPGTGESNLENIDANNADAYAAAGGQDALNGTSIKASGTGEGSDGGFDLGQSYLAFDGDASSRHAILDPIDSSKFDTMVINAIVGNDSNGGEDPDAAGEELRLYYLEPDGSSFKSISINPVGDQILPANADVLIDLGAGNGSLQQFSINLPSYARGVGFTYMLYQLTNSGTEFDHYGITNIKYQRRNPITLFVSLDSPEAISFINDGSGGLTPAEKKKRLEDMLAASDEYMDTMFPTNQEAMKRAEENLRRNIEISLDPDTFKFPEYGTPQYNQMYNPRLDANSDTEQIKNALESQGIRLDNLSKFFKPRRGVFEPIGYEGTLTLLNNPDTQEQALTAMGIDPGLVTNYTPDSWEKISKITNLRPGGTPATGWNGKFYRFDDPQLEASQVIPLETYLQVKGTDNFLGVEKPDRVEPGKRYIVEKKYSFSPDSEINISYEGVRNRDIEERFDRAYYKGFVGGNQYGIGGHRWDYSLYTGSDPYLAGSKYMLRELAGSAAQSLNYLAKNQEFFSYEFLRRYQDGENGYIYEDFYNQYKDTDIFNNYDSLWVWNSDSKMSSMLELLRGISSGRSLDSPVDYYTNPTQSSETKARLEEYHKSTNDRLYDNLQKALKLFDTPRTLSEYEKDEWYLERDDDRVLANDGRSSLEIKTTHPYSGLPEPGLTPEEPTPEEPQEPTERDAYNYYPDFDEIEDIPARITGEDVKMTIDDLGAAGYAAYKAGGGDAKVKEGLTVAQVIKQGQININAFNPGAPVQKPIRNPEKQTPSLFNGLVELVSKALPTIRNKVDVDLQTADGQTLTINPKLGSQVPNNIAKSILTNEPIKISGIAPSTQRTFVKALDQAFTNNVSYNIPINNKPVPYSDDHIRELDDGTVVTNTTGVNNTGPVPALSNIPGEDLIGSRGQAQVQIVVPDDFSEPYLKYVDHAYLNTNFEPGEVADPTVEKIARGVVGFRNLIKGGGRNTGAFSNYPDFIKGDSRLEFKIPYRQLPKSVQDRINNYRYPGDELRLKDLGVDASDAATVAADNKKKKKPTVAAEMYEPKAKHNEKITKHPKIKSPKEFFKRADIKPVYPDTPPPEMINGRHPDLVDGQKVSNRYNRLDPASAKAMPPTGNPHIDKKVRAAARKPK